MVSQPGGRTGDRAGGLKSSSYKTNGIQTHMWLCYLLGYVCCPGVVVSYTICCLRFVVVRVFVSKELLHGTDEVRFGLALLCLTTLCLVGRLLVVPVSLPA